MTTTLPNEHVPLSAAVDPLCSLALFAGRTLGPLVGRPREVSLIEQGIEAARQHMMALVLEGEPGIGKTRLLLAIDERVREEGFAAVAVTADEEIAGPFLLARSVFSAPAMFEAARATPAEAPVRRALDVLSNRDDPGLDSLPPDRRVVRAFDLAAVALRALAEVRPLAILIDDVQWADEDSLRLLRYVVRTDATSPILFALAVRPEETAFVTEAVTLLADMDRIGILRRMRLSRFTPFESAQLLQQALGGKVDLESAGIMHAQAEGVPFIVSEQALTYRDAGLIQQIDGVWTLARNADRLLPSAVRTLIQRRAARLPEETRSALAEAAELGRGFSLRDLSEVRRLLGGESYSPHDLATLLEPAVAAGLLLQHPDGAAADYSFTHDRAREYLSSTQPPPRRRAIHGAIVDLLLSGGDPPVASLPLLAKHALAAGRGDLTARVSVEAAQSALAASAPEEALRLVELAQPVASGPQNRVALLRLRDDALAMLRRSTQRLDGLTELAALVEALGDEQLELEVMLRRAAAFRVSGDSDIAVDLSSRARDRAAASGDQPSELAACIELAQGILGLEFGEGFTVNPTETDIDRGAETLERALELATALNDERALAAVHRELGIIATSRVRSWNIQQLAAGHIPEFQRLILAGTSLDEVAETLPTAPLVASGFEHFRQALELYDRRGDRQGTMSTIIAMATLSWAPGIHVLGSPQHIEEIRRLVTRQKSFTRESERQLADAQMLFGAHVYARDKVFPDVALTKGREAYQAARAMGERSLEFASAGSMAMEHLKLGQLGEADEWLKRAAAVASAAATPLRARQLETWRGLARGAAGDAETMCTHLERAIDLAQEHGRPAARCEIQALLAIEVARLGAEQADEVLLGHAARHAHEVLALVGSLPGHPPWAAQAHAALARVALARGGAEEAAIEGRMALDALDTAVREDMHLEILLPAAAGILAAGSPEERDAVGGRLQLALGLIAPRFDDADSRARWFRTGLGRDLTRLAGTAIPTHERGAAPDLRDRLDADSVELLRLVGEGQTNEEIAGVLGLSETAVAERLATLFAAIGAGSRVDGTTVALTGRLV